MNRLAIATEQDLLCTRCDTRNSGDSLYCVGCGAPLQPATPHSASGSVALPDIHCSACGNANPTEARFCVTCGAALVDRPTAGYVPMPALAGMSAGTTIVQHIHVAGLPTPAELPLGIRALWFVFAGLWLGQIWLVIAWLLNLTLIGLPLGMWMLTMLPQVMTLRQERRSLSRPPDRSGANFAVRAIYFVLIGWWLSLLWMELAWLASASLIGLPLAFLMFERVGTVTTLAES
jgi:uncharacterized membrane protein YccF (DUF307 family)